ncbi:MULTISPECIES: DNA polymerase III subunit chi [Niveibacterium]|uniref:DNA polymerase III subunit chi n=1 Tax=Niveibacterium microcysteis TaxID=2811415 RepID=A0ABX7MEN6_9RHOO|nr:DNA polymerase III subunit chi [Niveibacterium microcysteis]QSI78332.1 DNA polymerase III subunit chi [Niveibacterium microcysteis]
MTEVRFFHNAPDKLSAACRLTAAAYRHGRKVTVFAPEAGQATRFDALLWTFQPLAFVPHVMSTSPLAAETPVLIDTHLEDPQHLDVLINLGNDAPPAFERFTQVIEIVTSDPADRAPARARWAFYRERGLEPEANDLSARERS